MADLAIKFVTNGACPHLRTHLFGVCPHVGEDLGHKIDDISRTGEKDEIARLAG